MRITNFRRLAFWLLLAAFLSSAKLHDNAGGLVLSPAADNAPAPGATPASQDGSAASTTYRGGGFTVDIHEGTPEEPIDEQTRVDTMVRAFQRLPEPELQRLDIDIQTPIDVATETGAERARRLTNAWKQRQAELKAAVEAMVKPAEFMADIAAKLRDTQYLSKEGAAAAANDSEAAVVGLLRELEGLVDDVDNARDFHTIGGWPVLASLLAEHHTPAVRAAAAWAVGTAVKNSYDYQLWVLERPSTHPMPLRAKPHQEDAAAAAAAAAAVGVDGDTMPAPSTLSTDGDRSCLEHLVALLPSPTAAAARAGHSGRPAAVPEELQRRALYALSASLRGNTDVQEAVMGITPATLGWVPTDPAAEIANEEEAEAVFVTYLAHAAADPTYRRANHTTGSDSQAAAAAAAAAVAVPPEVRRKVWAVVADMLQERAYVRQELESAPDLPPEALPQVLSLPLLGDRFVTAPWAQRAVAALTSLVAEHRRLGTADAETDTDTETTTTTSTTTASSAATTSVGADKKAARAAAATVRATLGSVLVAVRELLAQAPGAWGPPGFETTPTSVSAAAAGAGGVGGLLALLQVQLLLLADLQGAAGEGLAQQAREALALL